MIPKMSVMTMVLGGALKEGRLTELGMLRELEEMGFDGVELSSSWLLEERERVDTYAAFLAGSRLEATCIDGGCNFVIRERAGREAEIDDLKSAIELAARLEAPIVLAAGSRLSGGITPEDGRTMIIEGLLECAPFARDAGITLAIENFGIAPTLQCAADHCLEVLDAVPGLAFVFDSGNFYFCGEDALEDLDRLEGYTRYVHLKDWVKSDAPTIADVEGAALGTGIIPNERIVRRVVEAGRVATLSLEVGAPGDILEAVRRDLATARGWLAELAR